MSMGFPDVCLTPAAPSPVPVPYPNMGMNSMGQPAALNVMISALPALNMGSKMTMTSGMEGGSAHPMFKMMGGITMGCPVVMINGMPGMHLTNPSYGNNFNNALGAQTVPCAVNVTIAFKQEDPAWTRPSRTALPGALQGSSGVSLAHVSGGVGYLRLERFSLSASREVERGLRLLSSSGVRSFVLDLRGNPGGSLPAGLDTLAQFLRPGLPWSGRPLLLLQDRHTASTAELLAATLQDHERAVLVGERSYGKGRVDLACLAGDEARVEPAVGFLRRSNGASLQGVGVEPDVSSRSSKSWEVARALARRAAS